ncbi:MAG TPA: hypothetical protein PLQ19_10300 [Aeromicrobium sp.]|nr:hypothetical protein [Aeromicrobium sp.]
MSRLVFALVFATFWLAGCGLGAAEPAAPATSSPSPLGEMTLSDLKIDHWPELSQQKIPEPPAAPAGLNQDEYDRMVAAVRSWALAAVAVPPSVSEDLPAAVRRTLEDTAAEQTAPELALVNVLDPDLELRSAKMTAAWEVANDGPTYRVILQTRAAYEVATADLGVRVIGVLRSQGVTTEANAKSWGVALGWQEFGAADCAVALEDFLTPGGDSGTQKSDLQIFVDAGNSASVVTPEMPADARVNKRFLNRCEAGGV